MTQLLSEMHGLLRKDLQDSQKESVQNMRAMIKEEITNLHLDMLHQFHIQQTELRSLVGQLLMKQDKLEKELLFLKAERALYLNSESSK